MAHPTAIPALPRRTRLGRLRRAPPRFVIAQIDGLAHEYLLRALAAGHTPHIQRLIAQGYRLQRWRCGLPSSTPATQSGIMYGNNWDIPAFRWYEKDTGLAPHCKSPAFAARIKEAVSAGGGPGILTGGSSYGNLVDGDARLALFTLSAMGRQRFYEGLRGLGWALLFALIPWRIIRIIGLIIWELARDIARTIWLWIRSGFRKPLALDQACPPGPDQHRLWRDPDVRRAARRVSRDAFGLRELLRLRRSCAWRRPPGQRGAACAPPHRQLYRADRPHPPRLPARKRSSTCSPITA